MLSEISKIKALPLGSIRLTDEYCVNALAKEVKYLLSFDEDRVLAGFRKNAGLDTHGAETYGGWESMLIGGHAMGHYFTALAQASVNSGVSESDREALKSKLFRILAELKKCQLDNGFLWGSKILDENNLEAQFDNVEQGKNHLFKEAWVPWYTMHKILEGLVAAVELLNSTDAKEILRKLADWVYNRVLCWDYDTRAITLRTEYGGMNDVMYEVYRIFGDDRYAAVAHAFDEEPLFSDILQNGHNMLTGKHANTTIPKVIGYLRRYQVCHGRELNCVIVGAWKKDVNPEARNKVVKQTVDASGYLKVAQIFWDNVISHHTYHTGGNSEWEHFRRDDTLDKERTNANCETCNVYNMLKLTRELFKITGERKYADYMESAFLNHILASQNPETGMTTYFQSMATGYFKVFSRPWEDFWCCTGSGMENFTKLGDSVCFEDGESLIMNIYMACEISGDGYSATVKTDIPISNCVEVAFKTDGRKISLKLRIPDWASGDITVSKNGKDAVYTVSAGYADLNEKVGDGDVVVIEIPLGLKVKTLCDNENIAALKFGPLLLAAKLGVDDMAEGPTGVQVRIPSKSVSDGILKIGITAAELADAPEKFVKRVDNLEFEVGGLRFVPYYLIQERYGIYWNIV